MEGKNMKTDASVQFFNQASKDSFTTERLNQEGMNKSKVDFNDQIPIQEISFLEDSQVDMEEYGKPYIITNSKFRTKR